MPAPRDPAMLARAARMYYLQNRSQEEIAGAIGVSRSNVSRVLRAARDAGIVEIRIHDPMARDARLERALRERFGLRTAMVAVVGQHQDALTATGDLAAEWLRERLPAVSSVALSWGSSVEAMVESPGLDEAFPDVEVLPLVGGFSGVNAHQSANALIRTLAGRIGGRHRPLLAPAVVHSAANRDTLLSEPVIGEVLRAATKADVAVIGIGDVEHGASASIVDAMALSPEEAAAFAAAGAVGDACTRFFDAAGRTVASPADGRVISIELAALRTIPAVLAVAVGARKIRAVHAALTGGLADVVVVDDDLARGVLAVDEPR